MSLRTPEEQIDGLMRVIERAAKIHRCNLAIVNPDNIPPPHSQLALTGVEHGRDVEILYLIDGYDVWIRDPESFGGYEFAQSDLSLDEAAQVIADAYMYDKAAMIFDRDFNMSTGGIAAILEDDERAQEIYNLIDTGSDRVKAGTKAEREAGLQQAIEAMIKQGGKVPDIVFTDAEIFDGDD